MKLIFERSRDERYIDVIPELDVEIRQVEESHRRKSSVNLPSMSETGISRHYSALSKRIYGVNDGFYPLGSCTMKYNPKINDDMAKLVGFSNIHPASEEEDIQGCLKVLHLAEVLFCQVTGMDEMSFQPAAGSQGELAGLLLIRAYHRERNDRKRNKIIVPDSAHGTNPASAAVAGFEVINIPSTEKGFVDIQELKKVVGEDTAGFMITNPNTIGLFDENIVEITRIIHEAGGLNYYDGANMNAIMGIVKPGDMGFDVIHLNLHKTFSTPHGGGGPGCGPVGCKKELADYLPGIRINEEGDYYKIHRANKSIGNVKSFHGHFLVVVRALTYLLTLGKEGVIETSLNAVLNANYLLHHLKQWYETPYDGYCMHEFIISAAKLKEEYHVSALDIAKTLLDYGIHPPTMYFPLIVPEALMIEPTETESKETLDEVIEIYKKIYERILVDAASLKQSPTSTVITRPDDVLAARNPILRYEFHS